MATIYVSINGDDANDGLTKALPKRNVGGNTNGFQAAHQGTGTGSHTIYIHNTGVPHTEEAGYMNFRYCDNKFFTISGYNDTQDDVAVEFTQGSGDIHSTIQIHPNWTIGSIEFQKVEFNQDAAGGDFIKYYSSSQDISATFDTCIFNQTATSKRLLNSTAAVASPTRVATFTNCTFNGPSTISISPIWIYGWDSCIMTGCTVTGYALPIDSSFLFFSATIPSGFTVSNNDFGSYGSGGTSTTGAIITSNATDIGDIEITDNVGTNIGVLFINMGSQTYQFHNIVIKGNNIDCYGQGIRLSGTNATASGTLEILRNTLTITGSGSTDHGIGPFDNILNGVVAYNSVTFDDSPNSYAYIVKASNIELHHNYGKSQFACSVTGGPNSDTTNVNTHHNTFVSNRTNGYAFKFDMFLNQDYWVTDSVLRYNILDGTGNEAFRLDTDVNSAPAGYFENIVDYNAYVAGSHLNILYGEYEETMTAVRARWDVLDSGSVNDANSLELSSVPGAGYHIFSDGSYAGQVIPTNIRASTIVYNQSQYNDLLWPWIENTVDSSNLDNVHGSWGAPYTEYEVTAIGVDRWKEFSNYIAVTGNHDLGLWTRLVSDYPTVNFIPGIKLSPFTGGTGSNDLFNTSHWNNISVAIQNALSITGQSTVILDTESAVSDYDDIAHAAFMANYFSATEQASFAKGLGYLPSSVEVIWYRGGFASTEADFNDQAKNLNEIAKVVYSTLSGPIVMLDRSHPASQNNSWQQASAAYLDGSVPESSRIPLMFLMTSVFGSNPASTWVSPLDIQLWLDSLYDSTKRALPYPGQQEWYEDTLNLPALFINYLIGTTTDNTQPRTGTLIQTNESSTSQAPKVSETVFTIPDFGQTDVQYEITEKTSEFNDPILVLTYSNAAVFLTNGNLKKITTQQLSIILDYGKYYKFRFRTLESGSWTSWSTPQEFRIRNKDYKYEIPVNVTIEETDIGATVTNKTLPSDIVSIRNTRRGATIRTKHPRGVGITYTSRGATIDNRY